MCHPVLARRLFGGMLLHGIQGFGHGASRPYSSPGPFSYPRQEHSRAGSEKGSKSPSLRKRGIEGELLSACSMQNSSNTPIHKVTKNWKEVQERSTFQNEKGAVRRGGQE